MARRKTKVPEEIVKQCDHCGAPLRVWRQRTLGSMICASGNREPFRNDGERITFFCSAACRDAHQPPCG